MSTLLSSILFRIVVTVGALTAAACAVVVGRDRLRTLPARVPETAREARVEIVAVVAVLTASALGRERLQVVSELWGLNLTGLIFALEGEFVAWLQATLETAGLTALLSGVYVYGYVFLLVFPVVAYAALPRTTTLRRLLVAYALNYAIGLVVYTAVFAHGPRNLEVGVSLLYQFEPGYQFLTTAVNERANVFPSLHTSLAVTVAAFAWLTREEYPRWPPVAVPLAVAVVVATMYLGLHWATDVVAGVVLGVASVGLACRYVSGPRRPGPDAGNPSAVDD